MYDSDEEASLQRQALPIEIPSNFDPTKQPQTGEEFLQHVLYETKNCQKCTYADIDERKIKKQTLAISQNSSCVKLPESRLPTEEWQQAQLKDFSKLRKFIQSKRDHITTFESNVAHLQKCITTTVPKLSTVINLSQNAMFTILDLILDHLDNLQDSESSKLEYETGIWIYSILATLEIPLSPDSFHCIRELTRKCSLIRSRLVEENNVDYTDLNLIICIVGRFYEQLDLADV